MNSNQGIFETLPNPQGGQKDSPFSVAGDPASPAATRSSPFAAMERSHSPFSIVDEGAEPVTPVTGKPAKLPERRKSDSPFQVPEPSEGFGFEAPVGPAHDAGAFDRLSPGVQSPLPPAEPAFGAAPHFPAPAFSTTTLPPAAAIPVAQAIVAPVRLDSGDFLWESSSIRQLELRAIFGVDRELNADEILQRARALPGIRSVTRVGAREMATIEGLKHLLPSLGLPGPLKLYSGSVPVEFIREGAVVLAILTDGGFAPGVREKLMIVARELSRLA
jgi:hypothetical protein